MAFEYRNLTYMTEVLNFDSNHEVLVAEKQFIIGDGQEANKFCRSKSGDMNQSSDLRVYVSLYTDFGGVSERG
jgi:hypothetical protein